MGRQAKIKAERRAIRLRRKTEQAEKMAKHVVSPTQNPPDLGVYAAETIDTQDSFGRR